MGPPKTTVVNLTELIENLLELEGWIATWAVGGVLPNFRKWSHNQLLSKHPTPAGSNLTLWSWQQLFWVAPSNFFYLGPGKTIVANFTELSSSPLELEGWIAAEITLWSLVAPLQQLMLLSSLPTPASSNLTLWS